MNNYRTGRPAPKHQLPNPTCAGKLIAEGFNEEKKSMDIGLFSPGRFQ